MGGSQAVPRFAGLNGRRTHLVAWAVVASTLVAVAVLTTTGGATRPASLSLVAMAVGSLLATIRSSAVRWSAQAVLVAAVIAWAIAASASVVSTLVVVALLVAAAWIGDLATSHLAEAEASEIAAREAFEHRAEMLAGVRHLVGEDPRDVAGKITDTLEQLGYLAAVAVRVQRDGVCELVGRAGEHGSLSAEDANRLARQAVHERSTVTDLDARQRACVAAPVMVEDQSFGALVAVARHDRRLVAADRQDVEVLATHYSSALSSHRRMRRQDLLLERLVQLDRLRTQLVTAVSAEVRNPLTVVSGITQVLEEQGDDLDPDARERFLARFAEQSQHLEAVLGRLLDVAQLQAQGVDPTLRIVDAVDLLVPVLTRGGVRCTPSIATAIGGRVVRVDASMIRLGVELLTEPGNSELVEVAVTPTTDSIELRITRDGHGAVPALNAALATQLIVSGGGELAAGQVVRLPDATAGGAW